MSVDPNIDYQSHDPEDREQELSDDPRLREAQLLERRMRDALATKENPLSDGETTSSRLKAGKNADYERRQQEAAADEEQPSGE